MAVTAGNDTWAVRIDGDQVTVSLRPANRSLAGFTRRQAWELLRALGSAMGQEAHASEAAELWAEIIRLEGQVTDLENQVHHLTP